MEFTWNQGNRLWPECNQVGLRADNAIQFCSSAGKLNMLKGLTKATQVRYGRGEQCVAMANQGPNRIKVYIYFITIRPKHE